jgi:hypothetical protein
MGDAMRLSMPALAIWAGVASSMGAGLGHAQTGAKRECHLFAVTADARFSRQAALERSQSVLESTIAKWRSEQRPGSGWRSDRVTIEAHEAEPEPYVRGKVVPELFLKPDVRTAMSYTVCWQGVLSAAVCTSGAKVCK